MADSADAVVIYGKDSCPYTLSARDDYATRGRVTYVNVRRDPAGLARMLELSGGQRRVPVIVEGDRVTIGYGGT
jgi:glutaredoxin